MSAGRQQFDTCTCLSVELGAGGITEMCDGCFAWLTKASGIDRVSTQPQATGRGVRLLTSDYDRMMSVIES